MCGDMSTSSVRGENCQCKNIIEEILGKPTMQQNYGDPWNYGDQNYPYFWYNQVKYPGCTWYPHIRYTNGQPAEIGGQFQLLIKYGIVKNEVKMINPTCDYEVTAPAYRRRVCACK